MKNFQILITCFLISFSYSSFGQSQVNSFIKSNQFTVNPQSSPSLNTDTEIAECNFGDYLEVTKNALEQYRPMANASCQNITICVTCCSGGYETNIILVVEPNDPKCKKVILQKSSVSNDF